MEKATRRRLLTTVVAVLCCLGATAQTAQKARVAVVAGSFWQHWNVQAGMDMSLQNPYGYDFSKVFPSGKTFGLDLAAAKWFAPGVGVRAKVNWENGLPLIENGHAEWVAPFGQRGENMRKGGYMAVYGDLQFNIHNMAGHYDKKRFWEAIAYPRIGIVYNFGISKGALLLGVGMQHTFRLTDRLKLYTDVAYHMAASGFVGSEEVKGTGTGSNSNGFLDLNVGVMMGLGKCHFDKARMPDDKASPYAYTRRVAMNPFWSNWFVQMAIDMTLQNPYGYSFAKVFPKGKSFGADVAVGKWFSPQMGVRGRVNWENGLVENKHLEWIPPAGRNGINHEKGGYGVFSADVLFNLHNILGYYYDNRKWETSAFVRGGLISNFAIHSGSPLIGAGIEQSRRLNDRLSIFADVAYQVTTSESSVGHTGMGVAEGSNGFFNVDIGITIDLGKNKRKFDKVVPEP